MQVAIDINIKFININSIRKPIKEVKEKDVK